MNKIAVLRKTNDKHLCETELLIKELNLKVSCINIPFKRKIKRKDKLRLEKCSTRFDCVFTSENELSIYEKGVSEKNWLYFFINETVERIVRKRNIKKICIKSEFVTTYVKEMIGRLGEKYRFIELHTDDIDSALTYADIVYKTHGLPVNVKSFTEGCSNCCICIKIEENTLSVCDVENNTEYSEVTIDILYPLSKYSDLPMEKILKFILDNKSDIGILKNGMVKIVGGISK